MRPIVTFPIVTVCGKKDSILKEKDNYVYFFAMENMAVNGMYPRRLFNAWDGMAERVKKMNLKQGSEVTIVATMNNYIDKDGIARDSFTIISIDYIRTNINRKPQNPDKEYPEEKPVEVSGEIPTQEKPDRSDKDVRNEQPKEEKPEEKKETPVIERDKGQIGMDEFESMFKN